MVVTGEAKFDKPKGCATTIAVAMISLSPPLSLTHTHTHTFFFENLRSTHSLFFENRKKPLCGTAPIKDTAVVLQIYASAPLLEVFRPMGCAQSEFPEHLATAITAVTIGNSMEGSDQEAAADGQTCSASLKPQFCSLSHRSSVRSFGNKIMEKSLLAVNTKFAK